MRWLIPHLKLMLYTIGLGVGIMSVADTRPIVHNASLAMIIICAPVVIIRLINLFKNNS